MMELYEIVNNICVRFHCIFLPSSLPPSRQKSGFDFSSIEIENCRVQHTRVFYYGHEKDIRAQVAVRYDVAVRQC